MKYISLEYHLKQNYISPCDESTLNLQTTLTNHLQPLTKDKESTNEGKAEI